LRATGRNVQRSLQRAGAGRSGLRFGGIATLLIVAEVAIAVAGLSGVVAVAGSALRRPGIGPIATDAYLTARLRLAVDPSARAAAGTSLDEFGARFGSLEEELTRRLEAEPGVVSTTYASTLPGMDHPTGRMEVEGVPSAAYDGAWSVRQAWVDPTFFDVLDQPILSGRAFDRRDAGAEVRPLIVNRTFVEQVLGGASAVGRRVRSVDSNGEAGPWREIVGVVNDLGMNAARPELGTGMYTPVAPGERHPVYLLVRPGGDPAAFVPRLRAIASSVEPLLLVDDPAPLADVVSELLWEARLSSVVFALIAVIAILLSTAGLYALMSFTVSERTREIGIRIALGARRSSIARIVVTLRMASRVLTGSTA
jgi:hypothetical protein